MSSICGFSITLVPSAGRSTYQPRLVDSSWLEERPGGFRSSVCSSNMERPETAVPVSKTAYRLSTSGFCDKAGNSLSPTR
ncbi:hypothetical protein D3C78_1375060 [compost metagenome]